MVTVLNAECCSLHVRICVIVEISAMEVPVQQ